MIYVMFVIGWLEVGEEKKVEIVFFKNYVNIQGFFKVVFYIVYFWYFGVK